MTVQSETDHEDAAALVCGMARWRLAIHAHTLTDLERQLPNCYLCVDSDIISMYASPASGAGYLGLRYYGRGTGFNSKDFAPAANLAGSLAQFILFELEGRQISSEPRLVLPAHAEETQRAYQRARQLANTAMQQALREIKGLKEKAEALAKSATQPLDSEGSLTQHLRDFVAAWMGTESSDPLRPEGIRAIEQAERYGELFSVTGDDGRYPVSERVLHASRYRFGRPINDFIPEFKLFHTAALRRRAEELRVDLRHVVRIVNEVELGIDDSTRGFEVDQLRAGTDAYALAWLDTVSQYFADRHPESRIQLKLISGSERMAQAAPSHVISPMALMGLYLRARLKAPRSNADGESHPAVSRLKGALDAVLNPLAFADGCYGASEYLRWCNEHSDISRSRDRGSFRGIASARLEDVLSAWRDVTNLLAASHAPHSVASRQSMIEKLKEIEPSLSNEAWLDAITKDLRLAERDLLMKASRLGLLVRADSKPSRSRNPPPLRLESTPEAQEVAGKLIWQFSYGREPAHKEQINRVLRSLEGDGYIVLLLGGLVLCATGDWRAARTYFDAAIAVADEAAGKSPELAADGVEACYAHAIACHVGAAGFADLKMASAALAQARDRFARHRSPGCADVRFETEELSIELIELWGAMKQQSDFTGEETQARALALAERAARTFIRWSETVPDDTESHYIRRYCLQELACTSLQAQWMSQFALHHRQLLRRPVTDAASQEGMRTIALWLTAHCVECDQDELRTAPMVTALVRVNAIVASKYVLGSAIEAGELRAGAALCDDAMNHVIPFVDTERFLFLRLMLTRTATSSSE